MEKREVIRSKHNDLYKRIKSYQGAKYRKRDNCFLAEGEKTFLMALSAHKLLHVVMSEGYYKESIRQISESDNRAPEHSRAPFYHLINGNDAQKLTVLSDNLFLSVSELKTSQGILGVFELPASSVDVSKLSRAVILEGVQDPKNVGALIRSAHCLGYDAVFLDECCAHPFSPKVIRASMGSVFCIPVLSCETTEALQLQIQELKDKGFFVVGTDVAGTEEIVRKEKIALLIGNEGSGLSPQSLELCDYVFRIKMASSAESLNAAVAGGIAMYLFNCDDVEL